MPPPLIHHHWLSPIGDLHLVTRDAAVVALEFGDIEHRLLAMGRKRFGADVTFAKGPDTHGHMARVQRYFAGDLAAIDDIAIDGGGTPFQQRVWALLKAIPTGVTRTYGDLAKDLGEPGASRAVGLANGSNPISLIVPCHRVIGANGALTGYGGGIERKKWLLAHERVHPAADDLFSPVVLPRPLRD